MLRKFFLSAFLLFAFLGLTSRAVVSAKPERTFSDDEISQVSESGDFKLRDHSGFRVHVFVHSQKPTISSSPVCNLPDPDSLAVTGPAGWHLPLGTWTYTLNTGSVPSAVGSSNFPAIASSAFGKWSNAIVNKVIFAKSANTSINQARFDGKNTIAWGRAPNSALAVTYAWYNTLTSQVAEVDTIFNTRFSWSWTPYSPTACVKSNSYDVQDILTHETGHWMGLDDFYTDAYANNTMYGYGALREIKKDTLTTGDINGVKAVYP